MISDFTARGSYEICQYFPTPTHPYGLQQPDRDPRPVHHCSARVQCAGENTCHASSAWHLQGLINYRFWTLKPTVQGGATKPRVLAEWAGESKPLKGAFEGARRFLKPFSEEQIELGREIRISPEDEQWINQGRF